ncbi:CUE domain-containing protein 3 [Escovopsis weberi]|uniref:CUE domain-containing protein 3 n=1 Tax=Escovopsis weberi TaxID=150374 RepID=A0A0M8N1G3_ESCWE|nr:CUE domain-containing protein 3 [Escovopsis weberi]
MASLPSFAPFPGASWRPHLSPQDWDSLAKAWIALSRVYTSLDDAAFAKAVQRDESLSVFVATFVDEIAAAPILAHVFAEHTAAVETSLMALKRVLITQLELGIKGDLKLVEAKLAALNPLLHASPDACVFFLAGSDFFDSLVTCFQVMNPPLRQAITTTLYLCLARLAEAEPPKWSMISDQLFGLQAAAESHKSGPLNANDSLVADLVTNTPILRYLLRRVEGGTGAAANLTARITALQTYKTGVIVRPRRMSQITQVQDLFPDLGAGFVSKCLDEDRSGAPSKAAILSALAAFDSDDDERDDTYDAADVGGTVDAADQEADGVAERNEEALFRAYQSDPKVFGREAETRRSAARGRLREETGMPDEAIEGWALMLARNPGRMKRLEAKFAFKGQQERLERTAWRATPAAMPLDDMCL